MIKIKRTNAENSAFKKLVELLNTELARRDGGDHPLSQFNDTAELKYVVLATKGDEAVGCGAIASYGEDAMEIKRMYVSSDVRGQRIGEKILAELENWVRELGVLKCMLFTGSKQPEANKLYQRNGYKEIGKYGKLKDIPDSHCFAKNLL